MDAYEFSLLYQNVLYILTFNSSQRGLKAEVPSLILDLLFYNQDENLMPSTSGPGFLFGWLVLLFKAKLYIFTSISTILFVPAGVEPRVLEC